MADRRSATGRPPQFIRLGQHAEAGPRVSLVGAGLAHADPRERNLTNVDLAAHTLQGAALQSAWWPDAQLDETDLSRADLSGANLHRASLVQAKLVGTTLRDADLSRARLDGADLTNADLSHANLEGASLRGCDLSNAILTGTNLDEADIRLARGIRFDQTEIRGTRFTVQIGWVGRLAAGTWLRVSQQGRSDVERAPDAVGPYPSKETDDPWSALRRNYTGPAFARTLLALALFLLPNVLRAAGLVFFSEAESQLVNAAATATRTLTTAVAAEAASTGGTLSETVFWVVDALEQIEQSPRYDVWQVLLGVHKGDWQSIVLAILFGVLLFYNLALRYPLTVAVSGLREAEERSGITPARSEYDHLYQLHRVARVLWWVALASGLINLGRWLLSDVVFVW
jgi:hypothetical protein